MSSRIPFVEYIHIYLFFKCEGFNQSDDCKNDIKCLNCELNGLIRIC